MDDDREARIRERAYQIWQAEGEPHGRHQEHWDQAATDVGGGDGAPAEAADAEPGASAAVEPRETAEAQPPATGSAQPAKAESKARGRKQKS